MLWTSLSPALMSQLAKAFSMRSTISTDGGTINLAAGTFAENLTIDKPLTLIGAGQGSTTIDATGGAYGIHLTNTSGSGTLSGVTIQDLTITNAIEYSIHTNGPSGVSDVAIENVTATGSTNSNDGLGGGGVDLNGVTGTNLVKNLTAIGNAAFGLSLPSASGVTVENLITVDPSDLDGSRNGFGDVGIFPSNQTPTVPSTGISFIGATVSELITIQPGSTTITAGISGTVNVTLPAGFTDQVRFTRNSDDLFSRSYVSAGNGLALAGFVATFSDDVSVEDIATGNFTVAPGLSIQAAINAASSGATINLQSGSHTLSETLLVDKSLSIVGPNAGTSALSTRLDEAIILGGAQQSIVVTADDVTIDGVTVDATGTGFDSTAIFVSGVSGLAIQNSIVLNQEDPGFPVTTRCVAVSI